MGRVRARHETALAGFLVASLKLCAAVGMVRVGTAALNGIRLAGNASDKANRTYDQLEREVAEILKQAVETDRHEDRLFGDARGDELPEALASKANRLARLRQAKAQLEADAAAREQAYEPWAAAHTAAKGPGWTLMTQHADLARSGVHLLNPLGPPHHPDLNGRGLDRVALRSRRAR